MAAPIDDAEALTEQAGTGAMTKRERPVRSPAPAAGWMLARGDQVARYVILDRLAAGGMGEVYSAYDPQLSRRVALKILRPDAEEDATQNEARLLREAQAMAQLSHPNVVTIHDVGTFGDRVFIAMEFIDGRTLHEWLGEQPRSWRDVLDVFLDAGKGLSAAHRVGLMHRDFKPQNVLVGKDGRVCVVDFGLARAAHGSGIAATGEPTSPAFGAPLTVEGAVLGTPGYMSPEQLTGQTLDARTDQFSFCVALYKGLYGAPPFAAPTYAMMLEQMRAQNTEYPSKAEVPVWVQAVLKRGLAPQRDQRFASMQQLLVELHADLPGAVTPRIFVRQRAALLLVLAAFSLALAYFLRDAASPWAPVAPVLVLCVVFAIYLGFGRRTLLSTDLNQQLTSVIGVGVGCALVIRTLGVLAGAPLSATLTSEGVMLTGLVALCASIWHWSFAVPAAGFLAGSIGCVLWPAHAVLLNAAGSAVGMLSALTIMPLWGKAMKSRM